MKQKTTTENRKNIKKLSVIICIYLWLITSFIGVQAQSFTNPAAIPQDWLTPAEKTDYRTTPRFSETLEYLKRLEKTSPLIKVTSFGTSGEGRELILVVAAKDKAFTPEIARKQKKAIVFLQACIHAGESDGKDAGLALLRDIMLSSKSALTPKSKARSSKSDTKDFRDSQNSQDFQDLSALLDNVVLIFTPIYNVDGHERFGAYNRINQNGPEQMGFRSNATNLNLNRDYIKADAPETRAFLRLWKTWNPDLFLDSHVTDGADYRYNITYQYERHQNVAPSVRDWLEDAFPKRIVPNTENAGNLLAPYLSFEDNRDLSKGVYEFLATPRFATGYVPLRNRPGILIESHMLKPHKNRVKGTYDFVRAMLTEVNQNKENLLQAVKQADAETVNQFKFYDKDAKFPLQLELTRNSVPFLLKGFEARLETSEISGTTRIIWTDKPIDFTVPFYGETKVSKAVAPPIAYIVPRQYFEVIELLEAHGLAIERTTETKTFEIESYKLSAPRFAPNSFESRIILRDFKIETLTEKREFPKGSAIIRLNQPAAKTAIYMLEPNSPDSLLNWGFFNAIFEQKEYAEGYKSENLAREMLTKNPDLKREFEEKLKSDENFAKSPAARLNFFYERSPYFTEQKVGFYPVGRILK